MNMVDLAHAVAKTANPAFALSQETLDSVSEPRQLKKHWGWHKRATRRWTNHYIGKPKAWIGISYEEKDQYRIGIGQGIIRIEFFKDKTAKKGEEDGSGAIALWPDTELEQSKQEREAGKKPEIRSWGAGGINLPPRNDFLVRLNEELGGELFRQLDENEKRREGKLSGETPKFPAKER